MRAIDTLGRRAAVAAALVVLAACTSREVRDSSAPRAAQEPPRPESVRWEPVTVWEGDAAFERVRAGRPDARDPHLQVVGVDQAGHLVLVHVNEGVVPRGEVIYDNRSEMTGLAVGDVDPDVPGEEIYAGGCEPGEDGGGWVFQASVGPGGTRIRRLFTPGAYVHAMEIVPPAAPGAPTRLVTTTHAAEIHVLTPTPGDGPWAARLVYSEPPRPDAALDDQRPRIKDIALIRDASGRPPHEIVAVFAGGRAVYLDLEREDSAQVIAEEEGGWGRVCADAGTGAYACGYKGRIVHFTRGAQGGFAQEVIDQEGVDSGLRGMVTGRFPLPGTGGETARVATFGFHALCRVLFPRSGAWDPVTLFKDTGRGHAQIAADLVPGNDADELVLSGWSKRIVVLVARRER